MTVTAADFHAAALRLFQNATLEIDHRNAISRLYYAAYHACLLLVSDRVPGFRPHPGHSQFCNQLMSEPAGSPMRRLGIALNHLRQQRNAADYTLNRDFNPTDTRTAFGAYDNVVRAPEAVG